MKDLNLKDFFEEIFSGAEGEFLKLVLGNPRRKSQEVKKVSVRPVLIGGALQFQWEHHEEKKVTHRNMGASESAEYADKLVSQDFKQVNYQGKSREVQVLAAKPEHPKFQEKKSVSCCREQQLTHNRAKKYIINPGEPCDFLIRLGVMLPDGQVAKKHYGKFRQINRFLEIVEDSLSCLTEEERGKKLRIVDFGCGKSYLTFGLYYYLRKMKNLDVEIVGLDLKKDVISFCSRVAEELSYEGLTFLHGDIATYDGKWADMVVTLHACDTATDYAFVNAVRWGSKVILSVPCCQHELFKQIQNRQMQPMLKHGILKDRFTEILTDGLRGLKLESFGYDVSMIEFTSLEHTARNIMIKAIYHRNKTKGQRQAALQHYEELKAMYQVNPTTDLIGEE